MKECVVVCTYLREPWLHCCLRRLREQDKAIDIFVFSDRGETSPELEETCKKFNAHLIVQPTHSFPGNSWNAGTAWRFAYNCGYELLHIVEDDTMAKPDLLSWSREMHEELGESMGIFASCGWVFNHFMPFNDDNYICNWIYIPQFSITRKKLELVLPHLNYHYFSDMDKYLTENFPENALNKLYPQISHSEVDGLCQRVLMENKSSCVWCATPKVIHASPIGYNRGWDTQEEFFAGCTAFDDKVARVEEFIRDPYWRSTLMEKSHVEREEGRKLDDRVFHYKVEFDGWSTEFDSPLTKERLPKKIHSVQIPKHARLVLSS